MILKKLTPVIIFLLSGIFLFYSYTVFSHTHKFYQCDFGIFYTSVKFYSEKNSMYPKIYFSHVDSSTAPKTSQTQHDTKKGKTKQGAIELNPPFFILLLTPLKFFTYAQASWIWYFILMISGLTGIFLLKKTLDLDRQNSKEPKKSFSAIILEILPFALAFFVFLPTYLSILLEQVSLFLLPLVIGAWLAEKKQCSILSGTLLGIAASIKLFFGLFFFYFLIRREWKQLKYFISTLFLCNVFSVYLGGINNYRAYYLNLHNIFWYASSWNVSILGFLTRLLGGKEGNVSLTHIPDLTAFLFLLASGVLLFFLCSFYKPSKKINFSIKRDLDFSITLVAMLLLSPLGWNYYFPFLIIPYIVIIQYIEYFPNAVWLRNITALSLMLCGFGHRYVASDDLTEANIASLFIFSDTFFIALLILLGLLFYLHHKMEKLNYSQPFKYFSLSDTQLLTYSIALVPSLFSILNMMNQGVLYGIQRTYQYNSIYFGN